MEGEHCTRPRRLNTPRGGGVWVNTSTDVFMLTRAAVLEARGFCKMQTRGLKAWEKQFLQVLCMSCVFLPLRVGQKDGHGAISLFPSSEYPTHLQRFGNTNNYASERGFAFLTKTPFVNFK